MGEQDNGSREQSLPKELSETWCRQLVQIPGLSEVSNTQCRGTNIKRQVPFES